MGLALVVLILLPFIHMSKVKGSVFTPSYKILFWIFAFDVICLGWLGQKPMSPPYQDFGAIATIIYFAYFVILASNALMFYSDSKE